MLPIHQKVTLLGTIEGVLFQEGAPEAMQGYVVRLDDGQRVHTNVRNIAPVEAPVVEEVRDLVPTEFHANKPAKAQARTPRTPKAPHNAKLPSVDRP